MDLDYDKLFSEVEQRSTYLKTHWCDKVKDIPAIYQGDKVDEVPFNILFSNTETIVPALFSQIPTPAVRRRHGEKRGDLPAQAAERMLSYLMDTNLPEYPEFVDAAESAVLDAALPGQGQLRVRLEGEMPVIDYVPWDMYIWGYAKRWESIPWQAYIHDMTLATLESTFKLTDAQRVEFEQEKDVDASSEEGKTERTFRVYEVWHKASRKQIFMCEHVDGRKLDERDDPLQLQGFFCSPPPLVFLRATGDTLPRPLYNLYKQQAEELNNLTRRIKRVVSAIRVRGIYNGQLKELSQLFQSGDLDNALIPAESPALLERGQGLDNQIWMIPNEKLVLVLRELMAQREAVKATIYEILGIGDILRGVSRASETLGAQQIKDKWGSLRVTKLRERTARFLRDVLRLLLEVACRHMPEEMWAKITAVQAIPTVQAQVLQMAGQKPQIPSWQEILGILQDDMQRSYHIDIETNSTVDAEATQDKSEIAEFMTGLGQALQGLGPIAQQGPEGFEAVKAIIIEFSKKFRISSDVLRIIEALKAPPQQGGVPPEVQKMIQEAQQQIEQDKQRLAQEKEALQGQKGVAEKQMLAAQQKLGDVEKMQGELKNLQKSIQLDRERIELVQSAMEERIELREQQAIVNIKQAQTPTKPPAKS